MTLRFFLIGAIGLLLASDNPKDAAKIQKDSDLHKIQGAWRATSGSGGGEAIPEENIKTTTMVIEGDKYTYTVGEYKETGTFQLDSSKKPKAIDVQIKEGQGQGETQLGIYELKGDTLRLCFAPPGKEKERPKEFKTTAEGEQVLFNFKRDKR